MTENLTKVTILLPVKQFSTTLESWCYPEKKIDFNKTNYPITLFLFNNFLSFKTRLRCLWGKNLWKTSFLFNKKTKKIREKNPIFTILKIQYFFLIKEKSDAKL